MMKRFSDSKYVWKFLLETFVWSCLTFIAFILRLDGDLTGYGNAILYSTAVLLVVKGITVYSFGTFCQSWRNTGFRDLFTLLKAISIVSVIFLTGVFLFRDIIAIPYSIPFIEFALSLLVLSGIRVGTRFVLVYWNPKADKSEKAHRVLIAGAGESGNMAAREMLRHPEANMEPVAFLDDDLSKHGQKFLGIPVVGKIEDMVDAVATLNVDEILIAMPSESGKVIRRVVDHAIQTDAKYRIIPSIYDLISGKVTINQIRSVDVEDLLRRKPVQIDNSVIHDYIVNKTVLVTGAGGSIGSELVRQIYRYNPAKIILLGRGESSIHQLTQEIKYSLPDLEYVVKIGDVRDKISMQHLFRKEKPEVVFHAAAHKHVPLMEKNPEQAIFNNVIGTRNLVNLSVDYGVSHFVNISTDKAVKPKSVMGASKRISEQIVEWGAKQAQNGEVFVSVRFGNVLGSRGSVIPIFKEQIKKGGPVIVTHPDMIRYFMTIPEASQLVLQAGGLKRNGSVFVLDMGDPVNIEDMARDLIRLSGLEPDKDIKIEFSGVRPGEKLFEELLTDKEGVDITQHKKIFVSKNGSVNSLLSDQLDDLVSAAESGDTEAIKRAIKVIIPSYQYEEAEVLSQ